MAAQARDDLSGACDGVGQEASRKILAVYYVLYKYVTHAQATDKLFCSSSSVDNWVAWHVEGRVAVAREAQGRTPGDP